MFTNLYIVGSASYSSTITNHTEVLPVSVDIIGKIFFCYPNTALYDSPLNARYLLTTTKLAARGCDGVIFALVEALLKAGIVAVSQAGQTITGGQILYKA